MDIKYPQKRKRKKKKGFDYQEELNYCDGKVRSEHVKWKSILYYFSILPSNLKSGNQYQFSERNTYFVLDMLSKFTSNSDFKKIRNGLFIKSDSHLLKTAYDGFRDIMIDAGKSEGQIKRQLEMLSFLTLNNNIVLQIKKQSNLLKESFCSLIDATITENTYLTFMDRLEMEIQMGRNYRPND